VWFCDWLSGSMPLYKAEDVNDGRIVWLRRDGNVDYTVERRLSVQGSFDDSVQVVGEVNRLRFSGNPTKFLQGHNLYGSDDIRALFPVFAERLADQLGAWVRDGNREAWQAGTVQLTRVDLTRMYRPDFARPGWVPKWLAIAAGVAHGGHQRTDSRGAYDSATLYVGANSRRITSKMYDKAAELRKHRIGMKAEEAAGVDLNAYTRDCLRFEVELKSMELKDRGLRLVADWSPAIGDEILDERLGKLELNDTIRMSDDDLSQLPRQLLLAYHAWRNGEDLRQMFCRTTFYRYRRELKAYGVDIVNIRPRVLHAEPAHTGVEGRALKDYLAGSVLNPPTGWALAA
jgi:II/X family phage/plasmid replication protein